MLPGNEADIIIISLVRTKIQGFLANLRRINVMLTRCKVKMIICCNIPFLTTAADDTLVGKLAAEWASADEHVIDPLLEKVKWDLVFEDLQINKGGKGPFAHQKGKGHKKKLDLSKIGYGTRITVISNRVNNISGGRRASHANGQINGDGTQFVANSQEDADANEPDSKDEELDWNESGGNDWWTSDAQINGVEVEGEGGADIELADSGWGADWEADGWD